MTEGAPEGHSQLARMQQALRDAELGRAVREMADAALARPEGGWVFVISSPTLESWHVTARRGMHEGEEPKPLAYGQGETLAGAFMAARQSIERGDAR